MLNMIKIRFYSLSLILCLPLILAACQSAQIEKIDLQPCPVGNTSSAQCGTLSVFENRETHSGRKIDIHVAVIKAWGPDPAPDPIFYLAGGPGGSAIQDAVYARFILKSANEKRDIVLVDQRGTGGSNRLTCPRSVDESAGLIPIDAQMVQDLQTCLASLDADPSAYTTAWGMDDVDDVRAALGYDQINLYGESYGTIAEEVYLQRHGDHVRTMTLEGVTLIDAPIFEKMPHSSQLVLDFLVHRCQADAACNSAYPNFGEEIAAVISRVEEQPVDLSITNPRTGLPVKLNRNMLVLAIHDTLRNTESAVQLPRSIHRAYQGNWSEVAQFYARGLFDDASNAEWVIMNMTILCHEDWARLRPTETAQFSSGSYLNYEDIRRFTVPEELCAVMPRPESAALHRGENSSSIPVLLISNEADPQNPSENVADAKEHYPNSLTVVAPAQGHGYTGLDCRDLIISAFIETGTTKDLDTGCLQQVPLPAFNVSK
jgi:pimeloyl-ACP methyl ester carboxylesterase